MKDKSLIKTAKAIIENIPYISLATTNEKGDPWNTPLVAIHNKNYHFFWRSTKNAIHSQNIRINGKVFIIIFDSAAAEWDTRQAVYIRAKAVEITDEKEINKVLPLLDKKSGATFGNANKYLNDNPRRIYKAVPQKIWINVDGIFNGVFVDKRVDIELT